MRRVKCHGNALAALLTTTLSATALATYLMCGKEGRGFETQGEKERDRKREKEREKKKKRGRKRERKNRMKASQCATRIVASCEVRFSNRLKGYHAIVLFVD